jgi:hypothetical protein
MAASPEAGQQYVENTPGAGYDVSIAPIGGELAAQISSNMNADAPEFVAGSGVGATEPAAAEEGEVKMNPDAPEFKISGDALKNADGADAKELIAARAREVLAKAEARKQQENKEFQERM